MHIDGELHGAFIPKHVGCFGSFHSLWCPATDAGKRLRSPELHLHAHVQVYPYRTETGLQGPELPGSLQHLPLLLCGNKPGIL